MPYLQDQTFVNSFSDKECDFKAYKVAAGWC